MQPSETRPEERLRPVLGIVPEGTPHLGTDCQVHPRGPLGRSEGAQGTQKSTSELGDALLVKQRASIFTQAWAPLAPRQRRFSDSERAATPPTLLNVGQGSVHGHVQSPGTT